MVSARQPVNFHLPKPAWKQPNSWDQMQRLQHARWDMRIGQRVRAAQAYVAQNLDEAVAQASVGQYNAGDALDSPLVDIQRQRQARLNNIRNQQQAPVMQRLLNPPVVVEPPKDALAQYMEWMYAQDLPQPAPMALAAGTKALGRRAQPRAVSDPAMPTKMGLHYARPGQ